MDHLIRFTTAEGVEGTHHAGSLEEAVAFAERVRNAEGATDVRLFRLTEVPIEFKAYYKVEVHGGAAEAPAHAPTTQTAPAAPTASAAGQAAGPGSAPSYATAALPDAGGPPPIPVDGGPRLVPHTPQPVDAGTNGRRLFSR